MPSGFAISVNAAATALKRPQMQEPSTLHTTVIGLDLAKSVFQVHGIAAVGQVKVGKERRRAELLKVFGSLPPCLFGMEACATAHRELRAVQRRTPGRADAAQHP